MRRRDGGREGTRRTPALGRRRAGIGTALVAALLVSAVLSASASAAAGGLDPTFSGDGKQSTDFGFGSGTAAATVRQPDGKIVAVGSTFGSIALARYNPNGSLDTSFSGDGRQITDFGGFVAGRGVALQDDGKIVVVGRAGDDFALARYNPNGSLDTSFSGDGKQTTDFGGFDQANGIALQADGKTVAVGGNGANSDFALARYNSNGTLDTTLSGDGKQTTDFGNFDRANAVTLLPGNKPLAVGQSGNDFALARYNANGSLDTAFSGDGKQTTTFRPHGTDDFDVPTAVALQGDGKIVVAGYSFNGSDYDFALARYNPNGSLDTSFSGDGRQTTDFGGEGEHANAVALQGDGNIVAAGNALGADGTRDFALARYLGG